MIKRALDRGSQWSLPDVYSGLTSGSLHIWTWEGPDLKCVLVTQLFNKTLIMLALSGEDMDEWLETMKDTVEACAKSAGCDKLRIQGRRGWSRLLGYEIKGKDELGLWVMEKTL